MKRAATGSLSKLHVQIREIVIVSESGKRSVRYCITCELFGHFWVLQRRYSEFVLLHQKLEMLLRVSSESYPDGHGHPTFARVPTFQTTHRKHTAVSQDELPELPPKKMSWFRRTNDSGEAIEKRREELEMYLRKLLSLPAFAGSDVMLLGFLGIEPAPLKCASSLLRPLTSPYPMQKKTSHLPTPTPTEPFTILSGDGERIPEICVTPPRTEAVTVPVR
jgi:hypothetical protein